MRMENRIYASQVMPSSILHPPSSLHISIVNRQRTRQINTRMLRKITGELLAELAVEKTELGINLVATPEMTTLNETFLRHEGPTDVITFDYGVEQASRLFHSNSERYGDRRDAWPTLHGEMFICMDEVVSQSKIFKTSWQSETTRYLIHGVLHLIGHDDRRAAARRRMKRVENRLLRILSRRFSLAQLGRAIKLAA